MTCTLAPLHTHTTHKGACHFDMPPCPPIPPLRTLKSYTLAIALAEHLLGMVPVGTHNWHRFITPQELAIMAKVARLEMRQLAGMSMRIGGSWELSTDITVNYIAALQPVKLPAVH